MQYDIYCNTGISINNIYFKYANLQKNEFFYKEILTFITAFISVMIRI